MRKLGASCLVASLVVGLGVTVAPAAEDDSESSAAKPSARAPTWRWNPFDAMFGSKDVKKPVEKKASPKPDAKVVKKPVTAVKPASIVDEAVTKRSREEAALLRRLQACDKIREIAVQMNDNDLLRRADELEARAQTTYGQRTANLHSGTGKFESDEKTIDQYLGASKAHSADSSAYTVSAKDRGSRAAMEETKP